MRTPVTRVPIKLRKPIHKDFCSCWGTQTFAIDGIPQYINGDKFTHVMYLHDFLSSTPACLPIHFTYHDSSVDTMIGLCISMKIPVVVKTNQVLPTYILEELRKVPHSGIQVSINFLDGLIKNRLEDNASDTFSIREMISLAKSWKIFVSLAVEHQPHLTSKLDLFEIVDNVKNYVSHILISYPDFTDVYFHEVKAIWESLSYGSAERFRQYYMPHVPTRTWAIRPRYRDDIISSLSEYLKGKKIGLEIVEHKLKHVYPETRIRHISTGLSDLPLGIRPFFYEKSEEGFVKVESLEGFTCEKCEKSIFV